MTCLGLPEYIFMCAYPFIIGAMVFTTFMADTVDKPLRHRVDFQASCFNLS